MVPQLWHHYVVSGLATTLLVEHLRGQEARGTIAQAFLQSQNAVQQADYPQLEFLRARYQTDNPRAFMKRLLLEAVEWLTEVSTILRDHTKDLQVVPRAAPGQVSSPFWSMADHPTMTAVRSPDTGEQVRARP